MFDGRWGDSYNRMKVALFVRQNQPLQSQSSKEASPARIAQIDKFSAKIQGG